LLEKLQSDKRPDELTVAFQNKVTELIFVPSSFIYGALITRECPKSLEPMGNLIIFLIFIYRLKLKVKGLKMTLTLDERVEIVLLSGRQGWTRRQLAMS
jgi:hypothetical protein